MTTAWDDTTVFCILIHYNVFKSVNIAITSQRIKFYTQAYTQLIPPVNIRTHCAANTQIIKVEIERLSQPVSTRVYI